MTLPDRLPVRRLKLVNTGFTLIEVLLVVAIVSILAASTIAFGSSLIAKTRYRTSVQMIKSTLKKAQAYAALGKGNSAWGVCVTGSILRLFQGSSCASPVWKEDYDLTSQVTVTGLSTPVYFGGPRGEASAAATINISTPLDSTAISVNAAGGIN